MNMKLKLLVSVIAALTVTLFTGLIDVTPMHLVGATWHGWPLPWLYVIVYPGSPISIDWLNLFGDIIVWFVLALSIVFVALKFEKASKR